jgi:hypothetical protein
MRLSYLLVRNREGFIAECVETDAVGEGKTAKDAVASLRAALEERMFRPDAIAPPSEPAETFIELVLAKESEAVSERAKVLDGPGASPR